MLVQVHLFSTWVKVQVTGKKATQVEVKVLPKNVLEVQVQSKEMYLKYRQKYFIDLKPFKKILYRFVSTRWCYVIELPSSCVRWLCLSAPCQHQWLIRTGHRYFSNDVNHSMGPALIGQEIDDSVDFTPGDMFHHIVVY